MRCAVLAVAIAIGVLTGCSAAAKQAAADDGLVADDISKPRMLVYTRTAGWRHDSIPDAVETLRALAAETGHAIAHSEDPGLFDDATLAGFTAVIFANTTGDVLDDEQQAALERFVVAGGGFVGIHAAADTEYDWPWYGELVGARFESHPPGLQTGDVRFERPHGPDDVRSWRVTDEFYNYRDNPSARVEVVARLDERDYSGGTMGEDHPIAWCHDRLGGRAWYTGLGHDRAIYRDARFRAHLLQGLRYVSRQAGRC